MPEPRTDVEEVLTFPKHPQLVGVNGGSTPDHRLRPHSCPCRDTVTDSRGMLGPFQQDRHNLQAPCTELNHAREEYHR